MKQPEGRYLVGDKAVPSLGAAVAYALHTAMQQKPGTSIYVRQIGEQRAVCRIDRDDDGAHIAKEN